LQSSQPGQMREQAATTIAQVPGARLASSQNLLRTPPASLRGARNFAVQPRTISVSSLRAPCSLAARYGLVFFNLVLDELLIFS
jgi:hypothetical protein